MIHEYRYTREDREKEDFQVPQGHIPVLSVPELDEILAGKDIFIHGPYSQKMAERIAHDMIHKSLEIQENDTVVVATSIGGEQVIGEVLRGLYAIGCKVIYFVNDAVALGQVDDPKVMEAYLRMREDAVDQASKYIATRYEDDPRDRAEIHPNCIDIHKERMREIRKKLTKYPEKLLRCITLLPTEWQARNDGYSFQEYVDLFAKSVDQPWEDVSSSQLAFIKNVLDPGKTIHIFIDEVIEGDPTTSTDLQMSIEGMTFANSVIKRNYPGAEMFSAPVKDSLNGHIYFHGQFVYEGQVMKNIRLKFENGKIIEASAEGNDEAFQSILNTDEGARFIGELGIGTNPGLTEPMFSNGLLVEKVGGTFHLALGQAYEQTSYDDAPVNMDNGNDSKIHWDITCVNNIGNKSRMYVDGKLVRYNGYFLGEEYAAINPELQKMTLDDIDTSLHVL